jgi:hypothetical protein
MGSRPKLLGTVELRKACGPWPTRAAGTVVELFTDGALVEIADHDGNPSASLARHSHFSRRHRLLECGIGNAAKRASDKDAASSDAARFALNEEEASSSTLAHSFSSRIPVAKRASATACMDAAEFSSTG